MSKNGNRYSEEFKQQIVDLYNSGSTVSYLGREYGVTNVTIYKWIKELTQLNNEFVQVSESEQITAKEYEKLKKRITELEMENDTKQSVIVKKKLPPYSLEKSRGSRCLHRKI